MSGTRGGENRAAGQQDYFLSKGVRCGASQKKTPRDSTRSTARGVLLLGNATDCAFSQEIKNGGQPNDLINL